MIKLKAALQRRKLTEQIRRNNSSDVNSTDQRCFLEGNDLVLVNILSRLPVKTLMKFKLVCRHWRCLIKHNKCLIDLHFTLSKTCQFGEHTFLLYPTSYVNGTIPIKKLSFCQKDLKYGDNQGGSSSDTAAIVTSNNMTLGEKSIYMLEPVNGLFCFVKGGSAATQHAGLFYFLKNLGVTTEHASIMIYNPSTQEKTLWIETLSSAVFRNLFSATLEKKHQVRGFPTIRMKTSYEYHFGFGIDPSNDKHKVLCIIEITVTPILEGLGDISRELICGVFTVGENTWRKIEQVPPEIGIGKDCVHVHGSIYWMSGRNLLHSQDGIIKVFDLVSETFRLIKIPNFIRSSIKRVSTVHELVEVDGKLALLVRQRHDLLSLWFYNVNGTGSNVAGGNWVKETMQLPCPWDEIHNLVFKAIAGTSMVVIKISRQAHENKKFHCEFLHFYDRREKKFYGDQSVILWEPGTCGVTYSMAPFYGTLLPV